jgi:hypothetical protein
MSLGAQVVVTNFCFRIIFLCFINNWKHIGVLNAQHIYFDHNLWYGPSEAVQHHALECLKGMNFSTFFVHQTAATNNTNSIQ